MGLDFGVHISISLYAGQICYVLCRYIDQLACAHGLRWKDAAECEVFDLAWSQLSISAANNQGLIRVFDLCWVC